MNITKRGYSDVKNIPPKLGAIMIQCASKPSSFEPENSLEMYASYLLNVMRAAKCSYREAQKMPLKQGIYFIFAEKELLEKQQLELERSKKR